jgi:hypothetical protein
MCWRKVALRLARCLSGEAGGEDGLLGGVATFEAVAEVGDQLEYAGLDDADGL